MLDKKNVFTAVIWKCREIMDNLVWFDESLRGILVVDFGIVSWYNFELDN